MSKKKNTLKDLDEFLKQQAASIVEPARLSEKVDTQEVVLQKESDSNSLKLGDLENQLKALSEKNGKSYRENLYDFVIRSLESLDQSLPEDKMLINTALYLKSGDQWKDVIRQYWRMKR
jgi:hypothetical protein